MLHLKGRKIIVQGVSNERSIAYHTAQYLTEQCGAEVILLCQNQKMIDRHNRAIVNGTGAIAAYSCNMLNRDEVSACMEEIKQHGRIDGYVHSIASTDPAELARPLTEVSEKNFTQTMLVSCYSFPVMVGAIAPLMTEGGGMVTYTYIGGQRPVYRYGMIGLAKAALEQAVRYLAVELGPQGILVNALSASPEPSVSAKSIPEHYYIRDHDEAKSLLGHLASYRSIAFATAVHLDPQWEGTGQVDFVDCGTNVPHSTFPYGKLKMEQALGRIEDPEVEQTFAEAPRVFPIG